jgi:HrpA-like RNA helicase
MSSTNNINPFTNKAYSANYFILRKTAQTLPVSQRIPQLLSRIKQNNVVVVVGETGSGKTTQLPKAILLDDEFKKSGNKLALTQNRRLAAQLVSCHVLNFPIANTVTKHW